MEVFVDRATDKRFPLAVEEIASLEVSLAERLQTVPVESVLEVFECKGIIEDVDVCWRIIGLVRPRDIRIRVGENHAASEQRGQSR